MIFSHGSPSWLIQNIKHSQENIVFNLFHISFDTLENTVGMQEIQRKALFVLNLLEMSVNVYVQNCS